MRCLIFSISVTFITGCAGQQSANMAVGNDTSYLSLADQRAANLAVSVYAATPIGAADIRSVEASRCHRDTADIAPSEETLIMDLKIAAYGKGSDGISDIAFNKQSGLMKNCWYIITATARSFRLLKPQADESVESQRPVQY